MTSPFWLRYRSYFANLALLWIGYHIFTTHSYYVKFLSDDAVNIIYWYAAGYSAVGAFWYTFSKAAEKVESKGLLVFRAVSKTVKWFFGIIGKPNSTLTIGLTKEEKVSLLFLAVKFVYIPMMTQFFVGNIADISRHWTRFAGVDFQISIASFNTHIYQLSIAAILMIDVTYFLFGYMFESGRLSNKIRTVEPTILGWLVALACYPPFNGVTSEVFRWYASEMSQFGSANATFVLRVAIVLSFALYGWATLALGTKSSNLTNRGIVSRGPYKYVRHPAYIGKNVGWALMMLPVLSFPAFLSVALWCALYHMRAVTEERHLGADPDYQTYMEQVKWRYIPGVI